MSHQVEDRVLVAHWRKHPAGHIGLIAAGFWLAAAFTGNIAAGKDALPAAMKPAVTINGVPISEAAVHREMNRLAPSGVFHNFSRKTLQRLRRQAITKLVDRELLYREGLRRGISWDEKWVRKTFSKTRQRYATRPKIYKALGEQKTRKRLMDELRRGQVVSRLINNGRRSLTVTEQELSKFYRLNKGRYRSPKIIRVQEIFFPVKPWASQAEWKKTKLAATAARTKVIAGKPMSSLPCNRRSGKSANSVVCIVRQRQIHEGAVSKRLNSIFSLKKGGVSRPLFTLKGYFVIQVRNITPPKVFAFKDVQKQVRYELLRQKHTKWLENLKSKLRKEANIVIAKGAG